jgi:hypothetical protein
VLHIKLHTPRHPLIGETPLQAAMLDLAVTGVISQQQLAFYHNQARPSFILSTDQILNADQMKQLRGKWDEQSQYLAAGGTPIMSAGLKPLPIYSNATDSQLAEVLKMSDQHIALAYRVPLQILGIGGTPFASTEALMQSWRASGLGFALNHVEEAFGQLFGLRGQPEEYVEFDTSVLLRSSFKERVEGWTAGIKGGLFAPNEARAEFSLSKQKNGDLVRVQQQDVPLSYGVNLKPPDPKPATPPPSAEQLPLHRLRRKGIHLMQTEARSSEASSQPQMTTTAVLPDALRDALGQVISDQRREWRPERELIEAQSRESGQSREKRSRSFGLTSLN